MSEVSGASVLFEPTRADAPDAVQCLGAYYAELDRRFPGGFRLADTTAADVGDMVPPNGQFLVVRVDDVARGCAGLMKIEPGIAEIKRMWIAPAARGQGLARGLVRELEAWASRLGMPTVRLDTAAVLDEAIALYASAGYVSIDPYNDNPYAAHWFGKRLLDS